MTLDYANLVRLPIYHLDVERERKIIATKEIIYITFKLYINIVYIVNHYTGESGKLWSK